MKKKRKKKGNGGKFIALLLLVLIVGVFVFFKTRPKLVVVSVVSEIDNYSYYMKSNATKIYKKYYNELEKELENEKTDEENYAKLISKLFIIDFYTLNNKVTNRDIGGEQFIHSNLKESFIEKSAATIYKYVKNNLYGNRKQELPEVKDVEVKEIKRIRYDNKNYSDNLGYDVLLKLTYEKDLKYPKEANLKIIHEENKLVIVEVK